MTELEIRANQKCYNGCLKSRQVQILVGLDRDFKWDLKSESWKPTIWNWLPFCQSPLEIWTKMSVFEGFGFWMVTTKARTFAWSFKIRTIWKAIFKKFVFKMFSDFEWLDFRSPLYSVWIQNVFGFRKVGFKIPSIFSQSSNITISSHNWVFRFKSSTKLA